MQKLYNILGIFICVVASTVLSLPSQGMETQNIDPRQMEELVNSTIQGMISGVTEPLVMNETIPLNFNDTLIFGTIELADINIYGLSDLLIPYLSYVLFTGILDFEFVVPVATVDVLLNTDIKILDVLPIYGNNVSRIIANNLQIKGTAKANLSPASLTNLDVQVHLESISLELHGLLESEEFSEFASNLLTLLANQLIVPLLNDNAAELGPILSPIIEDLISGLLSDDALSANLQSMASSIVTTLKEKLQDELHGEDLSNLIRMKFKDINV